MKRNLKIIVVVLRDDINVFLHLPSSKYIPNIKPCFVAVQDYK